MRVFTDFLAYDTGVYEHMSGADEGLHAVVVVGYDDRERFWIVRNSWGPDVGENGYFRIRYGHCEIDTRPFVAIDPERIR
jgi:C1A family cysteine protease